MERTQVRGLLSCKKRRMMRRAALVSAAAVVVAAAGGLTLLELTHKITPFSAIYGHSTTPIQWHGRPMGSTSPPAAMIKSSTSGNYQGDDKAG